MEVHNVNIGNESFQFRQLTAFRTAQYMFKMKELLAKGFGSGLDSNAANLMAIVDEKTLNDVIFPIFRDCSVVCTSKKQKIEDSSGMDKVFTAESLDEFFELVWEVLKFNFAPFIRKMVKLLSGYELEDLVARLKEKRATMIENLAKSNSETTLTENTGSGVQ